LGLSFFAIGLNCVYYIGKELAKNARVLNESFANWVLEQVREGRTDYDWSEAIQDYLNHAAELEERFTGTLYLSVGCGVVYYCYYAVCIRIRRFDS
jgi:hypothetical protein